MTDGARFDAMEQHSDPGLYWPIKRSFVMYVLRIADGQVSGSPDVSVVDGGTFVFAASDDATAPDVHVFRGELRLQAHNGELFVRVANPRVELVDGGRSRIVIDHPDGASGAVPMVTFVATACADEERPAHWTGSDVRLCVEAVPLFGGYYGEDEAFDDLVIVPAAR
jgi:hypothetical protein